jgi:hypothetical protein
MRTRIGYSWTIAAAICFLIFAASVELRPDPDAVFQDGTISCLLGVAGVNARLPLSRQPVAKNATARSTGIQRHTQSEFLVDAAGLPIPQAHFTKLTSCRVFSARSNSEKRPLSARAPPAA